MALQLKKNRTSIKLTVASSAFVIGATYLVFRTFPHLRTSIYDYVTGKKPEFEDDNEPIELRESDQALSEGSFSDSSVVDITQWSDDNLKSWLSEVSIFCGFLSTSMHHLTILV
ncbi:uncharacterized protein PRCAT00002957001 [Priceomyces carsonii]|uniref:uncharacterized protein n=1 Tax=Priceomyces carsonii TaxID=28549 RepID=UPI002ED805D4|nr:unnamed protein product [Priceomyces carsonii]